MIKGPTSAPRVDIPMDIQLNPGRHKRPGFMGEPTYPIVKEHEDEEA